MLEPGMYVTSQVKPQLDHSLHSQQLPLRSSQELPEERPTAPTPDETSSSNSTATEETSTTIAEEKPKVLCLLYIRGLSESIERSCASIDVKTVFTAREHCAAS